ncbi:hypothetical protein [Novosphingobium sp.]|uniref:hypothetical protein n=1 Tax=Novosphingobium sp. TaxID=1874826 RepID=UPI0035B227D8
MERTKRRSLVLTDETAGHPFRRSLPPHVRTGLAVAGEARGRWISLDDVRDFLMAYCACFLAVSLYIA